MSHCQSPLPYLHLHLLTQTRYVFHMLMCTSHPCSLQSLSLDCLNQMSKSLAQSKTIVKLTLESYSLSQTQDAKLFTRHLLLGLFGNNTLTDLTLVLPSHCWDWPQGELNILHCLKEVVVYLVCPICFKRNCVPFVSEPMHVTCCYKEYEQIVSNSISALLQHQGMYVSLLLYFLCNVHILSHV